jgi:hypothetical protein
MFFDILQKEVAEGSITKAFIKGDVKDIDQKIKTRLKKHLTESNLGLAKNYEKVVNKFVDRVISESLRKS